MWVVKIGGSLQRSQSLPLWLDTVTGEPVGRVVVVPGGGGFAEAVRASDSHWGLPSWASHRMAILGMDQFALMQGSEDCVEGSRAFLEKRAPVFTGK